MSRIDDRTLVLHIGLHKTASSYVQNVLSTRRYDLLDEGVLYPLAGSGSLARGVDRLQARTRDGAQSGHALFAGTEDTGPLVEALLAEMPESCTTVLLSSEDFTARHADPRRILAQFAAFGTVKVVLVLRRQDLWIESYYKQYVDQHRRFETRSFAQYLEETGVDLLDFHARFAPWRELVGPENFHALSYDDGADGAAIVRSLLEVAGVTGPLLDRAADIDVPRYDSVSAVDTVGLRVLNGFRIEDADARVAAAKAIYDVAPAGDLELLTPEISAAISEQYAAINERIESEWFDGPVPGFRFGTPIRPVTTPLPTGEALLTYLDDVMTICRKAARDAEGASA